MSRNKVDNDAFHYNNIEKKDKNFMYKNLKRSNCYNCNFAGSNFNFVSFRGAHFKTCSFMNSSFKGAEFIGTNFKNSKFKDATFEDAIFEGTNLDGTDFTRAQFKNTIFVGTDTTKARNLNVENPEIRIFEEMPNIDISEELKNAVYNIMSNKYVKTSRIFDNKEGKLNTLTVMILLEHFNEELLIKGLEKIKDQFDRDFHTISYVIKLLEKNK